MEKNTPLPKLVCHSCIGDKFLADEVENQGLFAPCSYCGCTRVSLSLPVLAKRVDDAIKEHFVLLPSEPCGYEYVLFKEGLLGDVWVPDGDSVVEVVAQIAEVGELIAADIADALSDYYQYDHAKYGEEQPYYSDATYAESFPNGWEFNEVWAEFQKGIKFRSRFFNPNLVEMLDGIFGDLASLRTAGGEPVICIIGQSNEGISVWRARQALSNEELKTILKAPVSELGHPPPKFGQGGRMNAGGITVFYGALDAETCISEIRPAVGSYVVLGKFNLLKPLQLLDLTALAEIDVKGSCFDPNYAERKGHAAFLDRLVRAISQPVMPQNEASEYLATQAVAEYLANKSELQLDGILFRSSQTGGIGQNVVLFSHACVVKPRGVPSGVKLDVRIPARMQYAETGDASITVFERLPDPSTNAERIDSRTETRHSGPIWIGYDDELEEEDDLVSRYEPTLELDVVNGVEVRSIKGVKYETASRTVHRYESY